MFKAALIIYIILGFILGPFWPLDLISGKAGIIGRLIAIGWFVVLIGGF